MKNPSSQLFNLIQSLTKTERRYFKLYLKKISFHDSALYANLFDVIDAQTEYNEKLVKQRLKQSPLLRNFKKAKFRLSAVILKCLDQYHSETQFESVFKNQFKVIYILYGKGLYDQCRRNILRLKKQVLFYERYTDLIELRRIEKRLPVFSTLNAGPIDLLEKEAVDKLASEIELQHFSDRIYETIEISESARSESSIKKYAAALKSSLLNDKTMLRSFRAGYYYYNALGLCSSALGRQKESYKYRKMQVDLIEKNPHQKNQYPELYISAIHNFLISCFFTRQMNEYQKQLKEFKIAENLYYRTGRKRLANSIFSCTAIHETAVISHSGTFHQIKSLIPELEEKLRKYSNGINIQVKLTLYYNIAYAFFGTGNYSKALLWINKLINHQKAEVRHDIQSFARILNLLIHYEMGNTDFLEHITRSAYRFISKQGQLYKYESLILNFIKKIYMADDIKKRIVLFKKFRKQFLVLSNDPREKTAFEELDILSWLNSKIEDRPFAEIVKEKYFKKRR